MVYYNVAENVEKAELLFGKELSGLMRENCNLLVDRYTRKGALVIDNLEAERDELFLDKDFPTEHYNEEGRKLIAKNVAEALKIFYPKTLILNE